MSTPSTEPLLITVYRVAAGHYVARAGVTMKLSNASGPDAAKACAAAKLKCEPAQVTLQKHAPGVFRAEIIKPAQP
jgi:hypothetical protein